MAKTRRQKQKEEELKSKNTGVGLQISINDSSSSSNKKITFDDNIIDEIPPVENEQVEETPMKEKHDSPSDDDDDDDAVEEVQGNVAREEIMEQLESEEKQSLRSKKKRKKRERKSRDEEDDSDEEEDFDEDFFAQLEAAKAQEKQKLEKKRGKGKHTAFVFAQDGDTIDERPRKADHNIQVVVLKDPLEGSGTANAITAVPTNALSNDALIYSRNQLINGSDGVARGATGQKRKWQPDTTWKRSKKMNHLAASRSRGNRRKGRGMAAANFVLKKR